ASGVLDVPPEPMPSPAPLPVKRTWNEIFPGAAGPSHGVQLVMIWAPWSAHSGDAFAWLDRTREYFAERSSEVSIAAAADPTSPESDVTRQLAAFGTQV